MKRKKKITKYSGWVVLGVFLLWSFFVIVSLYEDVKPQYVVMANGSVVDEIYLQVGMPVPFKSDNGDVLLCGSNDCNIFVKDLTKEWLDANLQCVSMTCNIHYNYSGRATFNDNVSNTWYGPIEFTEGGNAIFYNPGTQIVQECQPCEEYQYKEYTVYKK